MSYIRPTSRKQVAIDYSQNSLRKWSMAGFRPFSRNWRVSIRVYFALIHLHGTDIPLKLGNENSKGRRCIEWEETPYDLPWYRCKNTSRLVSKVPGESSATFSLTLLGWLCTICAARSSLIRYRISIVPK